MHSGVAFLDFWEVFLYDTFKFFFCKAGREMTFYEKMRVVCLAIPVGKVATYGQIALLCGAPKHARQVGYGLKNDLAGADVPAFRVVNGRGELSGACHFRIPGLQQELLKAEGVQVLWNGGSWCVDLKKYGWKTSAEEACAFMRYFETADESAGEASSK